MVDADTTPPAGAAPASTDPTVGGAERVIFFSDAVVAIAITLLALDLHVPEQLSNGGFWRDLSHNYQDYLGFVISFLVIGNHWLAHHRLYGLVSRATPALVRWNLLWLLMIVLTPFATRVIVADGAFASRFTVYALTQAIAALSFMLAIWEIHRRGLAREGTAPGVFRHAYLGSATVFAAFMISIPVAFATHWAYAVWAVIPIAGRVQDVLERRNDARRPAPYSFDQA
ncbi:TMEM175 family protein [Rugosimonospora acidiphila]|uniref:TMEM175 family protein n=1 Tax=Rugosimonospora acidiphila TaxID=556531 RepID=A0ABP9S1E5_9ACTN